jgi:hypothetical protein
VLVPAATSRILALVIGLGLVAALLFAFARGKTRPVRLNGPRQNA